MKIKPFGDRSRKNHTETTKQIRGIHANRENRKIQETIIGVTIRGPLPSISITSSAGIWETGWTPSISDSPSSFKPNGLKMALANPAALISSAKGIGYGYSPCSGRVMLLIRGSIVWDFYSCSIRLRLS